MTIEKMLVLNKILDMATENISKAVDETYKEIMQHINSGVVPDEEMMKLPLYEIKSRYSFDMFQNYLKIVKDK